MLSNIFIVPRENNTIQVIRTSQGSKVMVCLPRHRSNFKFQLSYFSKMFYFSRLQHVFAIEGILYGTNFYT